MSDLNPMAAMGMHPIDYSIEYGIIKSYGVSYRIRDITVAKKNIYADEHGTFDKDKTMLTKVGVVTLIFNNGNEVNLCIQRDNGVAESGCHELEDFAKFDSFYKELLKSMEVYS